MGRVSCRYLIASFVMILLAVILKFRYFTENNCESGLTLPSSPG
jgi:hypothetical protein